jgi:spore photoproduct lyase
MQTIYVEEHLMNHPRVVRILSKFNKKTVITCQHYGEIFNRKNQNFRQQKQNPSLILAEKTGRKVLPTPPQFGIGGQQNYYFSHLLNCPFDCRYCFLQGMYQSAHYVLFVNYEDFMQEIKDICANTIEKCYFFSGYDSDSLAYEPITQFTQEFVPFFETIDNCYLELRTKSANVRQLLKTKPSHNCIVAYSLNPTTIAEQTEHKAASTEKRISAIQKLAQHGYQIGLRLDPLIYTENFTQQYNTLLKKIATAIDQKQIHSISIGSLRFPKKMYDKIIKLYPNAQFLHEARHLNGKNKSYKEALNIQLLNQIKELIHKHFPETPIFSCSGDQ